MEYPMYVACPQCSAAVIVAEPVIRSRCRKCGAFFLLSSVVEPDLTAKPSRSRAVGADKQIHDEPTTSADGGDKPTPRIAKTRRRKSWATVLVSVCGLLLIAFLVIYFSKSKNLTTVVIAQDAATNDTGDGESKSPSAVIVPEPPPFEGNAFGQLDSLLLGASGFAGSWLTGAGAAADASYASSSNGGHGPPPDGGLKSFVGETFIGSRYPVEQGRDFSVVDWKPPGPVSVGPSGFGKSDVRVNASIKDALPDAKRKLEESGLIFVNVTPTAELEKDVVVTCKPPRGTKVKDGTKVEIGGGGLVPDVTKITITEAVAVLNADRFAPDYDTGISDKHMVTHQLPRAGDLQVRGGKVQFACGTTMPDVETRPVAEAADTLKKEDIVFVWGWREDYDPREYPSDVVCDQSIGRGELVFRGTKNLDRKQLELFPGAQVPQLLGMTVDDANREVTRLGIWVEKPRITRINLKRVLPTVGQQSMKSLQNRDLLATSNVSGESSSWRVLAQIRRQAPVTRQQWVHARWESDPAIIVGQRPQERQIICRGNWMVVDVEQKVYDVGYYQTVQQPVQNGGGFGSGGSGVGGQPPSSGIIQGGGGDGLF